MHDEIFGPVIDGGSVERALLDTVRDRTPTYLHWIEDQTDRQRGSLQPIAWWRASGRLLHDGDEPLPTCVIVSPGLLDAPDRGRGAYRAVWDMRVAVLVGTGGQQAETRDVAMLYGAAVRAAVVHDRTLGGQVVAARWTGETYDDLDPDEDRTLAIAVVRFAVDVADVVSDRYGPATLDPPSGEPPERPAPQPLDDPEITVTPEPLTEELT